MILWLSILLASIANAAVPTENLQLEVRVKSGVEAQAARAAIDEEMNSLKKLYAAAQTPYMGDISQAIGGCPPSMGPKISEVNFFGAKVPALMGAVNADKAFGECSKDKAKFKGAFFGYYDTQSKKLWLVRAFQPWTDGKLESGWLNLDHEARAHR